MNKTEIIKLNNVCKKYRIVDRDKDISFAKKITRFFKPKYLYTDALNNFDISIKQGEFVGLIGENGAGKTTSIKLMTGILTTTTGSINILGFDPTKQRKKYTSQIGVVMGQKSLLWFNIPVIESLKLYKEIYKVSDKDFNDRINFYKEIFDAEEILNKAVRHLSLGQRMRAELMASLIHKPKVLFLDEPTIGLDVVSKNALHQHLTKINEEDKTTIILTSHDSYEIEKLCSRLIVLQKGSILNDTTVEEVLKNSKFNNLEEYLLNVYKKD